jgi:hypothetical protein
MKLRLNHDLEEFIRTIDSLVSIVLQIAQLAISFYVLHYITHH